MSDTNNIVLSILEKAGIKFAINPAGAGLMRDNWKCDGWILQITNKSNTECFNYYTGIGRRVVSKVDKVWIMSEYKGSVNLKHMLAKYAKPVIPEVCGIIHSIIDDTEALHSSFSDWCDNFGYDNDSIKALNIYNQCTDNAKKLRKVIDNKTMDLLREALQDY